MRYPSRCHGPVTGEVGFAAASPADLSDWWGSGMHDWRRVEPRWPDGAAARDALAPHVPLTRYAFVPVTDGWTLMLNNAPRGTDMTVRPPSQATSAFGLPHGAGGRRPARRHLARLHAGGLGPGR